MSDIKYFYDGPKFTDVFITPVQYKQEYFQIEIEMESELFFELRKRNNILPYKLSDSGKKELETIKRYFSEHTKTFYFLFDKEEIIGSILWVKNYISSLSVLKKYQRKGYGEQLIKYAVNTIFDNGYKTAELDILEGNIPAEKLYEKIGFRKN
ncbi:GNAT family N-acetyltransferase [Breznakiella homolactica]|uniref:GNAT family N-acetyltransferase n=1 Tax=Breznakiella homolactica TaxID=2798577 RepID=A0A7T7XP75_9SPIR|nr:GNAT family N-acetyltransferase [Breznakiella homolactica]QQO09975.1 GNAT family N-acetyltransferase [Breznakiella homolactica]